MRRPADNQLDREGRVDTEVNSVVAELREVAHTIGQTWSTTRFAREELEPYADRLMVDETRKGLIALSLIALVLLLAQSLLYVYLGMGHAYFYTCGLLALLAVHVFISAHAVNQVRALHLLGIAMLVVSALGFVLLAHQTGVLSIALFASVALLFMVVPMMPWGLREAISVTLLIYIVFTLSTWSEGARFDQESLVALQFVMVGASLISLALVARNVVVRKSDIRTRYDLERTNARMHRLSNVDPLTDAWNRRYLKAEFGRRTAAWHERGEAFHFAFMDLDDFKRLNDTHGHDYGDQVLKTVSHAFRERIGEEGCLVRMGGDEFALLFSHEDPEAMVRDALVAARGALEAAGHDSSSVRISVGMATVAPGEACVQSKLYKSADAALYEAKRGKAGSAQVLQLVRAEG